MAETIRDSTFKGIWIPREVLLMEELSIQEKAFLATINGLDNNNGCFASNTYFSELFSVSTRRVIDIINALELKGYIKRKNYYRENSKEIEKRIITLVKYPTLPHEENCTTLVKNGAPPPCSILHTPHEENCTDIEKNIEKKINNKYSSDFESFWKAYPRKSEKAKAYKCYKARLNDGYSEEELLNATKAYSEECEKDKREQKYIKLGSTFLSASTPFVDYLKGDDTTEPGDEDRESAPTLFDQWRPEGGWDDYETVFD